MKKVLYGTTALLAAGMFASAAEAATPLKLALGGYLNAWVGYTDLSKKDLGDAAVNKFAVGTNGEIFFTAETKLDNGMKVGAVAELVIGSTDFGGDLDDVYAYAESKYGKVELGATDNVAKKLHNAAPDAGVLGTDNLVNWLGITPDVNLDSTTIDFDGNAKKISYFSPKFYGFQLAGSWVPGAEGKSPFEVTGDGANYPSDVIRVAGIDDFTRAYVVSAAYENKFGGVTVGADAGFGNFQVVGAKNVSQYSFGADVAFSGFTFGAGYAIADYDAKGVKDDQSFEFGAAYENGPYAVSASYFVSKDGKDLGIKQGKLQMYQVSGKYKLGAGVDAFATFAYLDLNKEATGTRPDADKVWTIVTGLALNF